MLLARSVAAVIRIIEPGTSAVSTPAAPMMPTIHGSKVLTESYRRPSRAAHARQHHISGRDGGADPHRRRRADRAVAYGFHDDAEPFELQHQIGNERDDADQRNESAEPAAFIFAGEKVGL
jgi:hypothetical protein